MLVLMTDLGLRMLQWRPRDSDRGMLAVTALVWALYRHCRHYTAALWGFVMHSRPQHKSCVLQEGSHINISAGFFLLSSLVQCYLGLTVLC